MTSSEILIVNGSPDPPRNIRDLLERAGYEVRELVSTDDALIMASDGPPMAIVFEAPDDVGVPVQFARRLRRHPATQNVPIVILELSPDDDHSEDQIAGVSWLHYACPPRDFLQEIAYLTRPSRKFAGLSGTG